MQHTQEQFWRLVLQERVGLIVTLCHQIGGQDGDCVQYFPGKAKEEKIFAGFRVECEEVIKDT